MESQIIHGLGPVKPVASFSLSSTEKDELIELAVGAASTGLPDFVGNLENIKQLLRLIDDFTSLENSAGLTVHKIGNCIVLDRPIGQDFVDHSDRATSFEDEEVDLDDALLLLPSDLAEEMSLRSQVARAPLVPVKNTFVHLTEDVDFEGRMNRFHSAPSGLPIVSEASARLSVSPPRSVEKSLVHSLLPQAVLSRSSFERYLNAILPFIKPESLTPLSRLTKAVQWSIAGFSVLLGCEIVVMDHKPPFLSSEYSAIKVLDSAPRTRAQSREAWLESSLMQVEGVAWVEGSSVEVTSTESLGMEAEIDQMLVSVQRVLTFLQAECKQQGSTYCLVRGPGSEESCHLYDISEFDLGQTLQPELALPMARVCWSLAGESNDKEDQRRLLEKAWKLCGSVGMDLASPHLIACVGMDLASLKPDFVDACTLLISALEACEWGSEIFQKLVISLSARNPIEQSPLVRLAWRVFVRGLRQLVPKDRLAVESPSDGIGGVLLEARESVDWTSVETFDVVKILCGVFSAEFGNQLARLGVRFDRSSIPTSPTACLQVCVALTSPESRDHATACNELGNLSFHQAVTNGSPNTAKCLTSAGQLWFRALRGFRKNKPLQAMVLMNLSRFFKLAAELWTKPWSVSYLVNRVRAMTCFRIASRLDKDNAGIAVGAELVQCTGMLTGEEAAEVPFLRLDCGNADLDKLAETLQAELETSVDCELTFAQQLRFHKSSIYLFQLVFSASDLQLLAECPIAPLRKSLLNVARGFSGNKATLAYEHARLALVTDPQKPQLALRHVNRCLELEPFAINPICLKGLILASMGKEREGLVLVAKAWSESLPPADAAEVKQTLILICTGMINRDFQKRMPNSRTIFEAVLRDKIHTVLDLI